MKPEEVTKGWLEERCTDDCGCLVWKHQLGRSGAPRHVFRYDDVKTTLHMRRVVWTYVAGKRIYKSQVVIMKCGNQRCLNPDHMQIIRRSEHLMNNNAGVATKAIKQAKVTRANRERTAKLDMDKARYVRASDKTITKLAEELGVSMQLVSKIRRGEAWKEFTASPFAGLGA